MRRRTQSRRLALQWLYRADLTKEASLQDIDEFLALRGDPAEVRARAKELIEGVLREREGLDREITRVAENWDLSRMATIDRNVLRLAAYEMVFLDTPAPVVLNEAVELAKTFSTENSGAFVNGILDRIRPERERLRAELTAKKGGGS